MAQGQEYHTHIANEFHSGPLVVGGTPQLQGGGSALAVLTLSSPNTQQATAISVNILLVPVSSFAIIVGLLRSGDATRHGRVQSTFALNVSASLGRAGLSVISIALRFVTPDLSVCGTLYSMEMAFDSPD